MCRSYDCVILPRLASNLNQSAEASEYLRIDQQSCVRRYRSGEFHPLKGCQYPTLPLPLPRGDATKLRHRLNEQDRRKISGSADSKLTGRCHPGIQGH